MESDFDFCARRAAEEFVAANRAQTVEQRKHHRQLAERYADLVRAMLPGRNWGVDVQARMGEARSPIEPRKSARAA